MNILIVSQYFYPEVFRINDLAEEFQKRGHKITVLTGKPNYPKGKFFKGYNFLNKNKENYNGIEIYRSPIIPRGSSSSFRLVVNYISFIIGSILRSLFLLNKKFDIIFVFEPSPITVCLPAIFIKKIKKIPIHFWVLDLWPESVKSVGNITNPTILEILDKLVKFIYSNSDKILVSSQGFINSIIDKGVNKKKILYFPQWAEKLFKPVKPNKNHFNFIKPKSFKIMFAGNIGEAQDFKSIITAAKILKNKKHIHWIILGDGRKKEWLESQVHKYRLENNFHLVGTRPLHKMPSFYAQADCMLLSLKKEKIFSITIPAKLQTYLASAKPILAMIDGETSKIINAANAGFTCPSESPKLLASNVEKISSLEKKDLKILGKNALKYYNSKFERTMLMNKLEETFTQSSKKD